MSSILLIAALLAAGPNNGMLAQRGGGWAALGGVQMAGESGVGDADVADNTGNDLAEVIQTTVAPESWERMGGRGTIRYWPARARAARIDGDVQHSILGLLDQMNRRGR